MRHVFIYIIQLLLHDHFTCLKVGFDDVFREPGGIGRGDVGKFLSSPVRRVLGFVFTYTQVDHPKCRNTHGIHDHDNLVLAQNLHTLFV